MSSKIMLDYDPWWYYRYAKYLLDNNLQAPKWDLLSYFPPGRPVQDPMGWEYIVVISYKIFSLFDAAR
jgi:asparagine N-glycosylation enzyme membrane subunit Stt3